MEKIKLAAFMYVFRYRKRASACLLAALLFQGCSAQSRLVSGSQQTEVRETLHYYLYYPPGYDQGNDEYGLLLFLHGGGEAGKDLEALREAGPPKMLLEGNDFPFLILAPHNSFEKRWWNVRAVKELLDAVVEENRVDPDRIYLTGLSRGGSASWEMAVQYPDVFAALVVVCGMAPLPYASWLDPDMPIRIFHGTADEVIPFSESQQMADRLKKLGYNVELTAYEGVGHNSWDRAYRTEGLFEWIAAQSRNSH